MNKRKLLIISVLTIFIVAMSLSAISAKSTSNKKTIKVTTINSKYHFSFKVTDKQYKKIQKAVKTAKKKKFLHKGFKFKVKTNKVLKTNKGNLKIYGIVSYEGETNYKSGDHPYYPTIDFYSMKKGHKSKWIDEAFIGVNG